MTTTTDDLADKLILPLISAAERDLRLAPTEHASAVVWGLNDDWVHVYTQLQQGFWQLDDLEQAAFETGAAEDAVSMGATRVALCAAASFAETDVLTIGPPEHFSHHGIFVVTVDLRSGLDLSMVPYFWAGDELVVDDDVMILQPANGEFLNTGLGWLMLQRVLELTSDD